MIAYKTLNAPPVNHNAAGLTDLLRHLQNVVAQLAFHLRNKFALVGHIVASVSK